jgi:hypothetical protein
MYTKQDHAALPQRSPPLDRKLPKILVEGEQDSASGLRAIQERSVFRAGTIRPGPHHVMAGPSQCLDGWQREVLVRKEPHQTGTGYALYS